jgi:outer membrane protein OmpA-like peptidoglycan-associated protein
MKLSFEGKIMLRTLCLLVLLASSTIMQAHSDNDSIAHRAFWWSENGKPILDGNGQCIRNGSWEALGKPTCVAESTDDTAVSTAPEAPTPDVKETLETEADVVVEISETQTTEIDVATAVAEAVLAARKAEPVAAEPTPTPTPTQTPTPTADLASEPASEPATSAVTYSYPVELITTHILFDFDKNNLRVNQQEKIELVLMKARKAYNIFKVSLGGHADSSGTDDYNYDLSQRRINTAINYLNLRDMQTDTTMAWGETQLITNADGSENYELSRRVELVIKVQQKVAD